MRPAPRRRPAVWLPGAVAAICCAPACAVRGTQTGAPKGAPGPAARALRPEAVAPARARAARGVAEEATSVTVEPGSLARRGPGDRVLFVEPGHEGHAEPHPGHEGHAESGRPGDPSGALGWPEDEHDSHEEHNSHQEHASHSEDHPHGEHENHGEVHGGHDPHGERGAHGAAHGHQDITPSHDRKHSEDGHGHQPKPHGRGASSVAVGLVATTVMIPLVTSMALTDGVLGALTMKMLDTFVAIFLAVLWFSAFGQILDTFRVSEWFTFAKEVVCLLQVMVLYCVAISVAWLWRDKQMQLTTFTVCGAHYIAFAGIGASAGVQAATSHLMDDVDKMWSPLMSLIFVAMAFFFIISMYVINWLFFRAETKEAKKFNNSIDEMEVDIAGLVVSFLITQAVRQGISGHYPDAHFFLQLMTWYRVGNHPPTPTNLQRSIMLAWSVFLTIFAAVVLPLIDQRAVAKGDHWSNLGSRFLKVNMIMMVAWGYLLWGTWQFHDAFTGDPMYGHMVFACLCTFVALVVLYVLASLQGKVQSPTARETNSITVSGISLVAAWSWEHCFSLAFDIIGYRYEVGFEGLVPKLLMATVIPCILLPTYVKHVRTAVIKHEELEEEEREERNRRWLSEQGLSPAHDEPESPVAT